MVGWLEAVLTICSGLQLLDITFPAPGAAALFCQERGLIRNTQKLHIEHLLIMELAVKSQGIKTSMFFVPYGSRTTRGQSLQGFSW